MGSGVLIALCYFLCGFYSSNYSRFRPFVLMRSSLHPSRGEWWRKRVNDAAKPHRAVTDFAMLIATCMKTMRGAAIHHALAPARRLAAAGGFYFAHVGARLFLGWRDGFSLVHALALT